MIGRAPRTLIIATVAVLLLGGLVLHLSEHSSSAQNSADRTAQSLPQRAPNVPKTYLATGLLPPTNKWFSSLAFSQQSTPVFAYPISYQQNTNGFSVSNPTLVSSPNAIFGSHTADVVVTFPTNQHIVAAYDDLSVSVDQNTATGQTIAETRITQGSPFVFTKVTADGRITISSNAAWKSVGNGQYSVVVGQQTYGFYSSAAVTVAGTSLTVDAKKGDLLTVFTLPKGASAAPFRAAATRPITGTAISYTEQSGALTTSYRLDTTSGTSLFAATPQMNISGHNTVGSYTTLLGTQPVLVGNNFVDSQPAPSMPSPILDLSKLTAAQRTDLVTKLQADTADLQFTATDSYFGGKELYRAANLLELATSLHQTKLASEIQTKLEARLDMWLDPQGASKRSDLYFYYDTAYHGVVGDMASYGSDSFNDHHFHYGYFIYAAAIVARYDPSFIAKHGAMVNVLIADIASSQQSADFPKLRVFDAYAGHSWASGNGLFTDGSNQESSSEAVNAWYAMYLWSQVTHNQPLALESTWLYDHETKAATTDWLSVHDPTTNGTPYDHKTVGIVWGGKLDYSTFFSARPQATLGIQLLPMSPGQAYLTTTNIAGNLQDAAPTPDDIDGQFSDVLVMYEALANPSQALRDATHVSPSDIDGSDSQTYLYAWLYSHLDS